MNSAKEKLQGISVLGDDANFAVDAANSITDFIVSVNELPIQPNPKNFLERFFYPENNVNTLLQQIENFGESMNSAKEKLQGISVLGDDVDFAVNAANSISGFIVTIK